VLVAHTCNPSYSGSRDQEDQGLKPALDKQSTRPYLEETLHKKKDGRMAQGVGPEYKPQYSLKKKKC
jgi:hypothetical protein